MTEFAIETMGLSKSYGRIKAVNNFDLKVVKGTIHGFLGPNGSGKTTTIKLILGLLKPDAGSIRVFGYEGGGKKTNVRKKIGYMPELPKLPSFLKGRELLEIYGEIYGLPKKVRSDSAKNLLKLVGLNDRAEDRIAHYSKGMQQRLGMAQALVGDPELVILDEPSLGLDPIGMVEIRDIIKKISSEGRTVFLSSHLLHDVQQTCTHVSVIKMGTKMIEGSIPKLLEKLTDSSKITVELETVSEGIKQALEGLDFVEDTKWEGNKAEIICSRSGDFRAEVSRAISDAGGLIIGMRRSERNLEELFLELIKGGERSQIGE